ncbi:APC family permease, partial [Mycobacterium alsense]|uniref:APC family permease n=1 Tax=Mycobacterium alsense TaxID=324058 RepID=UPI000A6E4D87
MSKLSTAARRLLIGRPFRSDRLSHTLLPKRIALPVFASDALSSVAYAPEQVFLMLSVAGVSAYVLTPWIGLAVAAVMLVVVASYRQNVHAYPSGGGDFEVVTTNLGDTAGLVVASALMVDYVLTVAVSTASAMSNIGSAVPVVGQHKVFFCVAAIVLVMALNLRGVRESGVAFAIPTYAFIVGIVVMIGWGLFRIFVLGDPLRAESAGFQMHPEHGQVVGFALAFLVARSFSSGCAALTGVEAISNGVPAFEKPKSRNAATTLLMLGGIAVTLLMGIIVLAEKIGVQLVEDPATQLAGAPPNYYQKTLVAQLADTVFGSFHIGFLLIAAVTALILVLAANTAFNGFPADGAVVPVNHLHDHEQQAHREQRYPRPRDELGDHHDQQHRAGGQQPDRVDHPGTHHLAPRPRVGLGAQQPRPVPHHADLAQRERNEHADDVQLDQRGDLGAKRDDRQEGRRRQEQDAVGERQPVSARVQLTRQVAVLRQDRTQHREPVERGVGRQHQDQRGHRGDQQEA